MGETVRAPPQTKFNRMTELDQMAQQNSIMNHMRGTNVPLQGKLDENARFSHVGMNDKLSMQVQINSANDQNVPLPVDVSSIMHTPGDKLD